MSEKRGLSPITPRGLTIIADLITPAVVIHLFSSIIILLPMQTFGETLEAGHNIENVRVVAYDKGNFKMTGDWALLSDGRNLQIKSNLFADLFGWPVISKGKTLNRDLWKLRSSQKPLAGLDGVDGKIDSKLGLLCIEGRCYRLMAICPPMADIKVGKKCQSFPN